MKNKFKNNFKFFVGLIIGLIVSGVGTYAITQISATTVTYDNTNSGLNATNAQEAYDELVSRINTMDKKIKLYSAANDTIYYYEDGEKVELCSTNSSGSASCYVPIKGTITLYSTVAANPDNVSNPYSKTFQTNGTETELYLMPEGVIYWYGYKDSVGTYGKIEASGYSAGTATFNTNSVTLYSGGYSSSALSSTKPASEFSSYTTIRAQGVFNTSSASYAKTVRLGSINTLSTSYTMSAVNTAQTASTSSVRFNLSGNKGAGYPAIEAYNGNTSHHAITVNLYALWLE